MSDQSHRGNSFAKLRRIGVLSWSVLGVVALVVVIATALGALSGIIIPLLIAIIIGTLLEPLVVGLENRGLKTPFPSIIGLFTAILVLIGIFAIIGWGIIQQLPEIYQQLNAGWNSLVVWGRSVGIDSVWLERVGARPNLCSSCCSGYFGRTLKYGLRSCLLGNGIVLRHVLPVLRIERWAKIPQLACSFVQIGPGSD